MPVKGQEVHRAELRIVAGNDAGRVIGIDRALVLGRDAVADVRLDDAEASREHTRLTPLAEGLLIEDLDSMNGTFVNDERLAVPRVLELGEVLRIGTTSFELSPPETPVAPDPAPDRARANPAATRLRPTARPGGPEPRFEPVGRLVVLSGPGRGQTLTLARAAMIGRDPTSEIVIDDDEVSRQHVRISVDSGRAFAIEIGATNGTYVNGERLTGRSLLEPSDRLEVGAATLEFQAATDGPSADPIVPISRPTTIREILDLREGVEPAESGSRKWWTLAVVCVTVGMLFLDTTIVSVALPSITQSLHASFSQLEWLVDAYALALGLGLLTAGSVSDIIGRRHVFTAGIVVFTLFSAACGLATSAVTLDIFRGLQGIGGAMLLATSLALIGQEFPPAQRAVAYGAWGATTGVAAATGPLVGGALTQAFSWPAIFYVNVPIGIAALVVTLTKLVNLPGARAKVDVPGLVTSSASMLLLLFGIIRGTAEGWGSPVIVGSFVGAVLFGVAFVMIERRLQTPMLQLRLFRIRTLVGAAIAGFCLSGTVLAVMPYIVVWLQSIVGLSALGAGARLLPMSVLALVLSPTLGRLESRLPLQLLIVVGFVAFAAGFGTMTGVGPTSGWTVLLPGLILLGVGFGCVNIPLESAAVGVVPSYQSGMAAGVFTTFRQIGLAAGIASLGAVLQTQVLSHVKAALTNTPLAHSTTTFASGIAAGRARAIVDGTPLSARALIHRTAATAYSAGLSEIMTIACSVAIIGGLAAALLIRRRDLVGDHTGPAGA